jgi:polyisoprenoid-binding protein YceI
LAGRFSLPKRCMMVIAPLALLAIVPQLSAQNAIAVTFDPAATSVQYTLSATMHTVHGTFRLKHGEIQFDAATGKASGSIVVDATSGESGNSSRDHNMHTNVLESAKYPEIVFLPAQIVRQGSGKVEIPANGSTQLQLAGTLRLHGQDHDITMPLTLQREADGALIASASFTIAYGKWGLKNPSNFVLRVGDTVDLHVRATVRPSP